MIKRFFLILMLFSGLFVSCRGTLEQPNFISIFSGDGSSVKLKNFEQSESNDISLTFEGNINDLKVYALREGSNEEISCSVQQIGKHPDIEEKGGEIFNSSKSKKSDNTAISKFKITPNTEFTIGDKFKICGTVKSSSNQSLDFELPFSGANINPAKIMFSALKIGSASNPGFIKFKVIKSGNLFGITLVNAGSKKELDYSFPAFKAEEGMTIIYNLFLPSEEQVPPDGSLASSHNCNAIAAGETAFCFWGKYKKFKPERTNAILIRASKTGNIQDALLFKNPKDDDWEKDYIAKAAKEAASAKLWFPDEDASNAVPFNITPSKMIIRVPLNDIKHSAEDWKLTAAPKKPKVKKI